ncbi:MAG TPA: GAF domain-containing protein [Mycobacteriales bacterium]|nr:GAF domain-containing protein [Mycobacteriales bacterium]
MPRLADAREQFLTSPEANPSGVRDEILTSWIRSRTWNVAADDIALPYVKDPNLETLLAQTATPILTQLRDELGKEPVSIILTDSAGVVLERLTGDPALERYLDRVQLAPGFSYSEQFAGTNGIGSALESREPFRVFGHEHYAEKLETLACAGVPICHPTTGKVLGLLDLTCWNRDAGPLLVALSKSTAQSIERALQQQTGLRELALLREYLRTCQRTAGPVLALNNDVVMMNDPARQLLDPRDHSVLLSHAADAIDAAERFTMEIELPSGAEARVSCKPAWSETGLAGGVVQVQLSDAAPRLLRPAPTMAVALPGMVGTGALWKRCCQELDGHYRFGDRVAVEGEAGVGKLALLRAVHQMHRPSAHFRVMDAADCVNPEAWTRVISQELEAGEGVLVIRHADLLTPRALDALADALAEALAGDSASLPWTAVTVRRLAGAGPELSRVLAYFPRSLSVPPLRHHIDDLPELVPFLLGKLTRGDEMRCSAQAMQLLMRHSWPGNVTQLQRMLVGVVQRRRAGVIQPSDLPPECRVTSRRVLTPLESMERDAIVQSLQDTHTDKKQAAEALGMSRATIYRKIRKYGIDVRSHADRGPSS